VELVAADLANADAATAAAAASANLTAAAGGGAGLGSVVSVEALWSVAASLYQESLLPTPLPLGAALSYNQSAVSRVCRCSLLFIVTYHSYLL
jgi:hypothetical protein